MVVDLLVDDDDLTVVVGVGVVVGFGVVVAVLEEDFEEVLADETLVDWVDDFVTTAVLDDFVTTVAVLDGLDDFVTTAALVD